MLSLSDEAANRCFHGAPLMDDLPVAESHDPVTEPGQVGVSRAISLERLRARVVLAAIHLDDETETDQEVHPAHTGNENLASDAPAERMEPQPEEGLDARLADPGDPCRSVALREFVLVGHETEMESTIQRDRERLERAAAFEVSERLHNRRDGTIDDRGITAPVHGDLFTRRMAPASVVVGISRPHSVCGQSDVKPDIREHPHPVVSEGCVACCPPADASGSHRVIGKPRQRIPPLPYPNDDAATTKRGDHRGAETGAAEAEGRDDPAALSREDTEVVEGSDVTHAGRMTGD